MVLTIPEIYGSISVIDGQHRLFSYADEKIKAICTDSCKIMVTAIRFNGSDATTVRNYSARTFIEINTNQTRVPPTHLDAIAYEILGQTHPKAIAAQVILRVNERPGKLYGLFSTNQTSMGVIQATTVVSALKQITNLSAIQSLQGAQRGTRPVKRRGYESLFEDSIENLIDAENLIVKAVRCFEHYFNIVSTSLRHDWPMRGNLKGSSLEYAKVMAAFVSLLNQFISEGLHWSEVTDEINSIRGNIMQQVGMTAYTSVLFTPGHADIPDAQPSATDDFRFLAANRRAPTSIQQILAQRGNQGIAAP